MKNEKLKKLMSGLPKKNQNADFENLSDELAFKIRGGLGAVEPVLADGSACVNESSCTNTGCGGDLNYSSCKNKSSC